VRGSCAVAARFSLGFRSVFVGLANGSVGGLANFERNILEILFSAIYLRFRALGAPDDAACRVGARFL